MNNNWKNVLLICSLLFNLILIGFILYPMIWRPKPIPVVARTEINREALLEKQHEIREMRMEFITHKNRFMSALAQPDISEDELYRQLDNLLKKQIEMEQAIGMNLIEIRSNMTAEQARRFYRELPHAARDRRDIIRRRR